MCLNMKIDRDAMRSSFFSKKKGPKIGPSLQLYERLKLPSQSLRNSMFMD